ncbi:MAG: glutathione S-transferase family protein [Lysobacter sp.]
MYTLYYSPGAASMAIHWLLIELQREPELRLLDFSKREQKAPEYLALNPSGVVPTLVIDGEPMSEAAAILMHLADTHPEAGFAPAIGDPRRRSYYQWMFHLANMVQPLLRQWWYPAEAAGEDNTEAALAQVQSRLEAAWERIDAQLAAHGPYLLGEQVSVVDFYLTMLMRWARKTRQPPTTWPHLAAHAQRMKARPSFQALYERESLSEWG